MDFLYLTGAKPVSYTVNIQTICKIFYNFTAVQLEHPVFARQCRLGSLIALFLFYSGDWILVLLNLLPDAFFLLCSHFFYFHLLLLTLFYFDSLYLLLPHKVFLSLICPKSILIIYA